MSSPIPEPLKSMEHFLSIHIMEPEVLKTLIDFCMLRKTEFKQGRLKPVLQGKVLAMIFQKSSLRTRLGFETAMIQLGGHAVNLEDHQVGIGKREDVRDMARVISSMCDGIMARVFAHQLVVELANNSTVPVINGLSDWSHPCQALADVMTMKEHFGELKGLKLAYIGDGNNVARSLLNACAKLGISFTIAAPQEYQLDNGTVESSKTVANKSGSDIMVTTQPTEAIVDADVVYTDVWTSMGQENEQQKREKAFAGYQVNAQLIEQAKPQTVVMHCLPAYRNYEITDDMVDGPQSIIFQQAENRMHSQRVLLEILLGR
ncbi:MAG: ornithine carbamoyltransferase [Planctomycetota bacterium]